MTAIQETRPAPVSDRTMDGLPRYAVIFRTHFWDAFATRQLARLIEKTRSGDVFVLVDESNGPVAGIPHDKVVRLTKAQVLAHGFADAGEGNLLWFNGDYPLYVFRGLHGDYDYYLQLEYDVVFNLDLDALMRRIAADRVDFVGLTKGEPVSEWLWAASCLEAYAERDLRHQLICASVFSAAALDRLAARRLAQSDDYRAGRLRQWPMCEGFIPTEIALGGLKSGELSRYGGTDAYNHWPPFAEADLPTLTAATFVHPVLDQQRYIDSVLKYHVGLAGFLNLNSLTHRKLRRLPAPVYVQAVARSVWKKTVERVRRARGPGRARRP